MYVECNHILGPTLDSEWRNHIQVARPYMRSHFLFRVAKVVQPLVSGVRCLVSDVTIEVLCMYAERNHKLGPTWHSGWRNYIQVAQPYEVQHWIQSGPSGATILCEVCNHSQWMQPYCQERNLQGPQLYQVLHWIHSGTTICQVAQPQLADATILPGAQPYRGSHIGFIVAQPYLAGATIFSWHNHIALRRNHS